MKMKNVMAMLTVLILVCGSAQAVLITNGATVLLSDDFEDSYVGSPPLPAPTWDWTVNPANNSSIVQDVLAPGAYQGEKYLKMKQLGGLGSTYADFASQTSGTVKLTLMANTGTGGVYSAIKLVDSATGASFTLDVQGHATYLGAAGVYAYGTGLQDLGLGWADDVWKKVEFEYVIGSPTATATVDGITSAVGVISSTGGPFGALDRLEFSIPSTYATELNIDAVPEPATMVLLSLGGLGILRRRKA